jgi:F-type H+-transporting ATPase subunit a
VAAEPINFFQLIAHAAGRLPPVLVGTWIVMAFLLIFGYAARRSLVTASDPTIPDEGLTLRHLAEVAVEWIDGLVMQVSELHEARRYVPFFGSLFLFILTANFMGLIPGLTPPTSDTDLTFALGGICFVYYLYQGFAHQGPKYLLSFFGPLWWLGWFMVVIEVVGNLFRPISLGVRLFANMFADHHMLTLFTGLTYVLVPIAFYALGSIVCVVQALVFVILGISYVRMAAAAH